MNYYALTVRTTIILTFQKVSRLLRIKRPIGRNGYLMIEVDGEEKSVSISKDYIWKKIA